MIKVDLGSGKLAFDAAPVVDIKLSGDKGLLIFGHKPLLYKDKPFSEADFIGMNISGLEDIVPYLVGQSLYFLLEDGKLSEIAADYYCHERAYYSEVSNTIYISEDWRELPHKCMGFNDFQLVYFMNWDETTGGESFFKEIKYFCPTYKYVVENELKQIFMEFNPLDAHGFHDAVTRTVKAISQLDKRVGIMLSGGMDSTEIAIAAEEIGFHPEYYCAKINDVEMFDNIQDCAGAKAVADSLGLDFTYAPCSIGSFLDGWKGELSKHVPFSYKDGKFWEAVSSKAAADGIELLINGNNADYMHNFGYTMEDKASEKSYAHAFFKTMRKVTGNAWLDDVYLKHEYSDELKKEWHQYNKEDFSEERFIAWCTTNGNMYSGYKGLAVDEACSGPGVKMYDHELLKRMREMINRLDDGKIRSPRQLFLEAFLTAEMDGCNARAIMGAANANNIGCFIIHTSPLIYDACIKMNFGDVDVDIPKRESYEAIKDSNAYHAAEIEKAKVKPEGLGTPSDIWRIILGVLNKEFDVEKCTNKGYELLIDSGLFEEDKLRKLAENDIGVRIRVAWLGYMHSIYSKSLVA